MEELLEETEKVTPEKVVAILRNREGLNEDKIGYGNEKALNQMLAHHGIVFQPEDLLVCVSSNPYQMGEFVAYDLNEVFSNKNSGNTSVATAELNIPQDPFLKTEAYQNYERYRSLRNEIEKAISEETHLEQELLSEFTALNTNFWEAHYLVGKYNLNRGYDTLALNAFLEAETKEITTLPDREIVEKHIKKLKRSLAK